MATHHGKSGVVKAGGVTVAELDSWNYRETVSTEDDTAQGDTAQTHLAGIPGWNGSVKCHYDRTAAGQEALVIGASVVLALYPEGAGSGAVYRTGTATITEIGVEVAKGAVVSREFNFQGNGPLTPQVV
ncbi:hypothetical protein RA307_31695 [Xanthobacteraceae bacterium Astr-EGSB]|uniref:hypothetical protein n=1 Tax=Astrobacterium formosum TaxID=3069710 RepID=UPI0027AF17D6|nr:hypothetical protein [Xanthobacteraceae bacterium Astr-EGSB]